MSFRYSREPTDKVSALADVVSYSEEEDSKPAKK